MPERPVRSVAQIYGYTICLVSIIAAFIALTALANSIYNLQDPLRVNVFRSNADPHNLASLEGYKLDLLNNKGIPRENNSAPFYVPSDQEIKSAYEAAKSDYIAAVRLNSYRSITVSLLTLLIAAVLFLTHWRWIGRQNNKEA